MLPGYLSGVVYPIISLAVWLAFLVFAVILLFRLIVSFADPNPFGSIGRFGFKVRKLTEKWVYPSARFLSTFRIDPRWAPLLTLLIGLVLTYFALQIVGNTFFVIDGLTAGVAAGNPNVIIGFVLYGLLSILVLFIFIRFIASWFVFTRKTFLGFVMRVTNPIMLPVQKLIPPIGMFDISAMILLLVISFLQGIVLNTFVR